MIIILNSCVHQGKNSHVRSIDSTEIKQDISNQLEENNKMKNPSTRGWAQYQDSLRNVILKNKENNILKMSILQEMYIRNVVRISGDSLLFDIPFNLKFSFKFNNTLIFPEEVLFQEHEFETS